MAGLALTVLSWLVITALILAVPFGIWWVVDRSRRAPVGAAAPAPVAPLVARAPLVPARRSPMPRDPAPRDPTPLRPMPPDPPTAPVPVPRRASPRRTSQLGVVPAVREPADTDEILAADREVVVTREEDHQDVLAGHHDPGDPPTSVTVELWSSTVTRGTYRGDDAVEVRLDGERVGELTAAMSARYRHLVALAGPVRCRGVVTHGARGFQIDLRLPDVV